MVASGAGVTCLTAHVQNDPLGLARHVLIHGRVDDQPFQKAQDGSPSLIADGLHRVAFWATVVGPGGAIIRARRLGGRTPNARPRGGEPDSRPPVVPEPLLRGLLAVDRDRRRRCGRGDRSVIILLVASGGGHVQTVVDGPHPL